MLDLGKCIQDLLHDAERYHPDNECWHEKDVGKDDVSLKVNEASHVEVHVIPIKPEIVSADIREQRGQRRRVGVTRAIFAEHQLFAVGSLDSLVAKLNSGQANSDQRKKACAEY